MKAKLLAMGLCIMATTAALADDAMTNAATAPATSGTQVPASTDSAAPAPSVPTSGTGQVTQ